MSDGDNCICGAYSQSECSCGADWTTQEVYDLRQKLADSYADVRLLYYALKYHQSQTRPIKKTIDALQEIDKRLSYNLQRE